MDRTEAEPEDLGMPRSPFPERRLPGPAEDLPMDVNLLKVLASDSRRDILQHLRKRRMTLTELSNALDLKKATVLEHLKKLTEAGLIRRLEDERLWVYYELTHRGVRVVNPGRTRFYLLMSVAAAAALVLGGVTAALLATDVLDPPVGQEAAHGGRSALAGDAPLATGGGGVSVDVLLEEGQAQKARAYLLTASDADQLKGEGGAVAGIPLALDDAEATGSVARFRSLSAVPPGNYYLYVVDEDGRDNLASLSEVRVPSLDAAAPDLLWKGLSGDADFTLARDGRPANGTLLLVASEGHELPTIPLTNGTATLEARTLDRLVPATYQVQYAPEGSQFWILLDRAVDVREPLAAVEPRVALAGQDVTYRVGLTDGARLPDVPVPELDDERPKAWTASPDGTAVQATFTARAHGASELAIARLDPVAIHVVPDLRLRLDAVDENRTRLQVATPDGAPVPEVAVGLGTRVLDLTGTDGAITFDTPSDGAHELRLTLPDGTHVARGLVWRDGNPTEQPVLVRVRDVEAETAGSRVLARATLVNEGVAMQRATLALLVDGRTVATTPIEAGPGSAQNVTLDAPVRLAPGEHAVRLVATPLRHAPIEGAQAWVVDNATADHDAYDGTPAASGAGADVRDDVAYLGSSTGTNESVTLRVAAPSPPRYEVVRLEGRETASQVAPAAEGADAAPVAQTPGPGLVLALAAVGVALALRRHARP